MEEEEEIEASSLTSKVLVEVKEHVGRSGIAGSREICHLGWLARKVSSLDMCSGTILAFFLLEMFAVLRDGSSTLEFSVLEQQKSLVL